MLTPSQKADYNTNESKPADTLTDSCPPPSHLTRSQEACRVSNSCGKHPKILRWPEPAQLRAAWRGGYGFGGSGRRLASAGSLGRAGRHQERHVGDLDLARRRAGPHGHVRYEARG